MIHNEGGNNALEDEMELIAMERARDVRGIIESGGGLGIVDDLETIEEEEDG